MDFQKKNYARNASTMHALHHVLEKTAACLGWTVIGVVAVDLFLVGCEVLHHQHQLPEGFHFESWKDGVTAATPWLIFITAVIQNRMDNNEK